MADPVARPTVSIVILSHRPSLVGEALASATGQTVDCQVVVQHAKANWGDKLNRAVNATIGDWIVILCDDDLLDPAYVERCLRFAGEADIVYTDRRVFTETAEAPTAPVMKTHGAAVSGGEAFLVEHPASSFIFGSPLLMTIMIRRTLWDSLGGYDAIPHADTEFWYRAIVAKARTVYVPEPLFWYRVHPGQLSREVNSMVPALRAFHTKHFPEFGLVIGEGDGSDDDHLLPILSIPVEERAAYAAAHFPASLSVGGSDGDV